MPKTTASGVKKSPRATYSLIINRLFRHINEGLLYFVYT